MSTDPREDPRYQQWLAEQTAAGWAPEPDPDPEPEPIPLAAPADVAQQPTAEPDESQDQDQAGGQPMYYASQHPDDAAAGGAAQGHVVHGQRGFGAGVSN